MPKRDKDLLYSGFQNKMDFFESGSPFTIFLYLEF